MTGAAESAAEPAAHTAGRRAPTAVHPAPTAAAVDEQAAHQEVWDLVTRAQGGDGDAFGQLYDRYVDLIYRFIYYRLPDRGQAEDLTSETFVRALRRIGTISYQGRDVAAWFVTIARNLVLDHVKSARYRMEITTDEFTDAAHGDSTEAQVLATLTNERLLGAVAELSDEQQECITLRFLHGMNVAETAEIMGKNDGAIKALQHRAVKRLHALLAEELG